MKKILLTLILLLPILTSAAEYKSLVVIPGLDNANTNFSDYINSLYVLSISVAGLMAVIKIIIAGVQWMTTDIVTSKGEAKKNIQGALTGLGVVLAAVLVLNVINPQLTDVAVELETLTTKEAVSVTVPGLAVPVYGTESAEPYYYINNTSPSYSYDEMLGQIAGFNKLCYEQGGTPLSGVAQTKCYKYDALAGEIKIGNNYCEVKSPSEIPIKCPALEAKARELCVFSTEKGGKNGRFYLEPNDKSYSYCFYQNIDDGVPVVDEEVELSEEAVAESVESEVAAAVAATEAIAAVAAVEAAAVEAAAANE